MEGSRTWKTRGLGRLEDLEDSRTWKTRAIEHTRAIEVNNHRSQQLSKSTTTVEVINCRAIKATNCRSHGLSSRRTHEPSNALQPSSPTSGRTHEPSNALQRVLSNLRMLSNEYSLTFRWQVRSLMTWLPVVEYNEWTEQAANGRSRLQMDRTGWKWTEDDIDRQGIVADQSISV